MWWVRLLRTVALTVAALLLAVAGTSAADTPVGALSAAIERTAAAATAHVDVAQTYTAPGRVVRSSISGTLAHGDQDLAAAGDGGESRRVAKGTTVYERRPNRPDVPWTHSARTPPVSGRAFGPLTFPDGTSLADPRLYRDGRDLGTEQLPQGLARKITAEVNLAAVASALRLGAADAARLSGMRASVTAWIAVADGRLLRQTLVLTVPDPEGARTIETTIDLGDLDAPLVVSAP